VRSTSGADGRPGGLEAPDGFAATNGAPRRFLIALPCLGLALLDSPAASSVTFGGQCGDFPRTPGFSRVQHTVPVRDRDVTAREILVYRRVPEEATLVRLTPEGQAPVEVEPLEGPPGEPGDFYLMAVAPDTEGRVNWIANDGNQGSRGIELLPP
jgi:hypothetical protein